MNPSDIIRTDSLFVNSITGLGGPNDPAATTVIAQGQNLLSPVQALSMYRFDGVASRACRLWARDCTRKGWTVLDPSADPDPMRNEDQRLMTRQRVYTAILYACVFGAGYLLMVTDDDVDSTGDLRADYDPAKPLLPENVKRLVNLVPMTTLECVATVYETDATSPNYGRPRLWSCTPYPYMQDRNVITHHTRILYFPGTTLPNRERSQNRGADQSILQAAYEAIKNLEIIDASCGTYVQRLNRDTMKIAGLNAIQSSDQAKQFNDKMSFIAQVRSIFGMAVLDSEDDLVNQSAGIAGFSDLSDHAKDAVCAAMDMPRTILFGAAPGGLNTDGGSQRDNWQGNVDGHQKYCVKPALLYLYRIVYAQKEGPFRGEIPDYFQIVFHPLATPSPTEVAEIRYKTAEMDEIYIRCGVFTAQQVREARFGVRGWQQEIASLVSKTENTGEQEETFTISKLEAEALRQLMIDMNSGALTPPQARTLAVLTCPRIPLETIATAFPQLAPAATPFSTPSPPLTADALTLTLCGLPFVAEYQKGEVRRGINPEGTPWESPPLPAAYGYLRGMEGLDGDDVDVIWLQQPTESVYVIEHRFEDGSLDEHKIVAGASTPGEALNAYTTTYGPAANYGHVVEVPLESLIPWLENALAIEGTPDTTDTRTDSVPAKYNHINFEPPTGVKTEARRGLEWRREHGRGGTAVGVARARDLSSGVAISPRTARRMNSYFSRHEVDKEGQGFTPGTGYPSAGRIAWALWGGDAGKSWASKLVKQMEAADKQ